MPLIKSQFKPQHIFKNGHFSTIYSAKFRPSPYLPMQRERIQLSDDDFLDVDWSFPNNPSPKVAILLHGLEGNSQRVYMKGQAKVLIRNGWNVAGVNFRGCGGVPNLSYKSYNAGKTDDLEEVIDFILNKDKFNAIGLIGFSL